MKLRDLSKPQWDAAREAAELVLNGSVHSEEDRAAFRNAWDRLEAMLPAGVDVRQLIGDAAHWKSLNDIAGALAGIGAPVFIIEAEAE